VVYAERGTPRSRK